MELSLDENRRCEVKSAKFTANSTMPFIPVVDMCEIRCIAMNAYQPTQQSSH